MKFVFDRGAGTSSIARKLIALIIGFSALIALVTTGFQLSIDYRHDVKKINEKSKKFAPLNSTPWATVSGIWMRKP